MTVRIKHFLKKILPEWVFLFYHRALAYAAAVYYCFPSRSMIVVGVTGTKGKTSTANYIWSVLNASGQKTAMFSTANIKIGNEDMLNMFHMTMPGRFALQKLIARAKRDHCTWCIVETTSEGIKHSRHIGIKYDVLVLTNITPEHLLSHKNSYTRYRDTKASIFKHLGISKHKILNGKIIPKVIIVNSDSEDAEYFLNFPADVHATFSVNAPSDYQATILTATNTEQRFEVNEKQYALSIPGSFNIYNALPCIAIADIFNLSYTNVVHGFSNVKIIPGRMEKIEEGQPFTVFVDYAHEGTSMNVALNTARDIAGIDGRVIVLLGAEGGGRDKSKRAEMGRIAAEKADIVIVSNVDPYEDDPQIIADDIARSAEQQGKTRDKNLFVILDRTDGIQKAISLSKHGDVVIITGKGSEQSITIDGITTAWDDRTVVRNILKQCNATI